MATQVVRMVALYFGIAERCAKASAAGGFSRMPFMSAAVPPDSSLLVRTK